MRHRRHAHPILLATLAAAVACGCGGSDSGDADAAAPEPLFSLAVIADPHITGDAEREARLGEVIDVLNAEAASRKIELVLVVGDIGWSGGLSTAKSLLDGLTVPYVPLIGDNEIHAGAEQAYDTTFAPQFELLASTVDNWQKAPVPVENPESEEYSWFQNFSFDYRGLHIIAADWCVRGIPTEGWESELGYLHDFEGGTFPWLRAELEASASGAANHIIIASHIPMHNGTFIRENMLPIEALIGEHKDYVYANLAGHVHLSYDQAIADLYEVYVTAATWNDDDPLRVIGVAMDGDAFVYTHELIYVPFD